MSGLHRRRTPRVARKRTGLLLVAALIGALLPALVYAATPASAASDPAHVNFTLAGCKLTATQMLPNTDGKFVCDDNLYTTGNLGKAWNELDLVPFRTTTLLGNQVNATTTYSFAVALDFLNAGRTGYDVLSAPEVNRRLSHSSCEVDVGAEQLTQNQASRFRIITLSHDRGTTCVLDYFGRLSLGASKYPGASLHANLLNQRLAAAGIGNKEVSIPVKEILPQSISKDMTATQDATHVWNITKNPSPVSLDFQDTCGVAGNEATAPVAITVSWERLPATGDGDVTVVTNIYAKNPAHRTITVDVSDDIRSGMTVLDTVTSGPVDVPANTEKLVLTHTTTVPAATANLNDVATATYTDKVTNVAVPGTTTAVASATVQPSGETKNETATITDVESITGAGLSFSVDSFSGAAGTFDAGYVAGTRTTGPVGWTSAVQSGNGSVTFLKTVYAAKGTTTSAGALSDTATLTASDGFRASASASVRITSSALVNLTIDKRIPNVLQGGETATFDFQVSPGATFDPANIVRTASIMFTAGQIAKTATLTGLAPGTYTVHELDVPLWQEAADATTTITLPNCGETVVMVNRLDAASAQVRKVTVPAGEEADWTFTLTGTGLPAAGVPVTTTGTGFVNFGQQLGEGSYAITETARTGFDQTSSSAECGFSVDLPADQGRVFSCTFTNTKRATVEVEKTVSDAGGANVMPGAGFTFQLRQGASPTAEGQLPAPSVTTGSDGTAAFPGFFTPGSYQFCETGLQPGWRSSLSDVAGSFVPAQFLADGVTLNPGVDNSTVCIPLVLGAGDTARVSVNNVRPPDGDARTIGFWKNWSSCSGGRQDAVLDQTLLLAASSSAGPISLGSLTFDPRSPHSPATVCRNAVSILNKSTLNGKKMASDPLFNMAAQLLAAKLNVARSAATCAEATTAINQASALLVTYGFTGNGYSPRLTKADATLANQLADMLDRYNNNVLC